MAKITPKPAPGMPELFPWIVEPDKLHVGQPVFHFGKPDDVWYIEKIEAGRLYCSTHERIPTPQGLGDHEHASKQWFPIGSMAAHPSPEYLEKAAATDVPAPVREKKEKPPAHVGDPTARLLATCKTIDECWAMAKKAGLNVEEVKAKIGHLSNGLQRMGIGNRMRKLPDQDRIIRLMEKANG